MERMNPDSICAFEKRLMQEYLSPEDLNRAREECGVINHFGHNFFEYIRTKYASKKAVPSPEGMEEEYAAFRDSIYPQYVLVGETKTEWEERMKRIGPNALTTHSIY